MRYMKFITMSFVCLLVSTILIQPVIAQDVEQPPKPDKLFDKLAVAIFNNVYIMGVPWFVFRFAEPDVFTVTPNVIEADLSKNTEVTIGVINKTSGDYKSLKDFYLFPSFTGQDFEFSLELPDYLPKDAIRADFNPQTLNLFDEGQLKTTLIFTFANIPKDKALPENIVLRVNITKYTTAGNLYLPPKGLRGIMPFTFITGKYGTFMWFFGASGIIPGAPFGVLYGGKRTVEYTTYLDIIVKLNQTRIIDIVPPQNIELEPDKIYSIPIQVKNLGNDIDSFNFRVSTSEDSGLLISPPPAITLAPNEVGYTNLGIVTSENFWDPGTLNSIKIEAYSIFNPDKVNNNSVIIFTKGVHVSEVGAIYSAVILCVLVLVIAVFFFMRRKKFEKIVIKPDKPWEIPAEKEYLEKLKEKNKEEYNKVLEMMNEEYESALLWYKSYLEAMIKKEKQEMQKAKAVATEKKLVEKPKTKQSEEKKPIVIKEEKIEKISEKPVEKIEIESLEERRKQEAILRIKHEQEKQKKKFKP
ncbi:MAG: hypothetical protein NTV74_00270 [Euryarchaeota archaeon]|nr:hypothetical protein [Euryarchaeota archaeon]